MAEDRDMDEGREFRVSGSFAADLKGLYQGRQAVGAEADRAVMDAAARRFAGRRRRRIVLKWAGSAAAVAAVLVFAFVISESGVEKKAVPPDAAVHSATRQVVRLEGDIDSDGQVNILDAFKLARNVEAGAEADLRWDMNGDGIVDRRDVDSVAYAAVRLKREVSL